MKFLFIIRHAKSNIVDTPSHIFIKIIPRDYLPREFTVAICCGDFPWESAAAIFRGFFPVGLPWEFATAICRWYLPLAFVVRSCRGYLPWVWFVWVSKPFFCVSKPFFSVNKSLLTVFLFVFAVEVRGHRSY